MPRALARCISLALVLMAAACAAPGTARLVEEPGALPRAAEIAEVPFFPQERYHCGPAALAMALAWSGLPVTAADMVDQVYTPGREGTLAVDVVAAARRNGRLAVPVTTLDGLLAEIAAGHPVIVFQNLGPDWRPQWHFAVAVGYDLGTRQIVLHTGVDERRRTPLDAFERTWARTGQWALATLPPGELPASADARTLLLAASGLEQAGRNDAAAEAYAAIAARWPGEATSWLGLGNARYALGDHPGAEAAYREGIAADGQAAEVWNNLAYALHAQGRRDEAIAAAETAVALADAAIYRDTLAEVSGR